MAAGYKIVRKKQLRLITPETKRMSRPEVPQRRNLRRYGGLVIRSAEGIRFAHTDTPLPRDPSARIVPTAEFINPYSGLIDEQKAKMVEQFEAPNLPMIAEKITKQESEIPDNIILGEN